MKTLEYTEVIKQTERREQDRNSPHGLVVVEDCDQGGCEVVLPRGLEDASHVSHVARVYVY